MSLIKIIFTVFVICAFLPSTGHPKTNAPSEQNLVSIPVEEVMDKIRGGLLGQILGNLNGIPHENKYHDEPGQVNNYTPWLPDGARTDDDTDFEWVYIYEIQKNRNALLSPEFITNFWKERINAKIWCSNRFVRHLMDIGMQPPQTGYTVFNPWAEFNISGQFLCETFGLLAPGMPRTAANIGLNYTSVAINNEPAQTTQLFTTMIATAFLEKDVYKILDAGSAALDKNSTILTIIEDIRKWHQQYPDDWEMTRRLLRDKYTQEGGSMRDWNGYELNTGAIIASLLYGKGDFAETLKLAFNYGWDADCNAATVGTIVGTIYGYKKMMNHNNPLNPEWQIVDRYKNTTRENMPEDETITSFADRLIEIFEMVNEQNGGEKTLENNKMVYRIPVEQPVPVLKLLSDEEQKNTLIKEYQQDIRNNLSSKIREERAKAAYMAVCLGLDENLAKSNPKGWKAACYDLSGYWKIMNNVYFGDFKGLHELRRKFESAGFKTPQQRYSDEMLYNDFEVWKDPESLY
ncbi:MAG: ADP-ribosylglycohydrolase family protein [Mariniphaga sp.]|nr:ADP-ribosylglycohydrolase family protein [Mariniphaga sp.]MDD4226498.1 ADP-ribosylglycohydrolase family protein [Mariniphaga sp.]MDD4425043.1 ADP-ribosylglycohydrolase family protein [Mariniphaga sp.]